MKKFITITVIFMLAVSFLLAGNTKAEAMNNESAALLTAGIVLLGVPVMRAIAREVTYPQPAYVYAAPPPRYIERTKIIYVQPRHKKHHRHWPRGYARGYRDEWNFLEYRRGRHDAREDYRYYQYDDY